MSDQSLKVYNGRYELQRRVARGGMAEVFLARDLQLNRPVALKVLFPEFATDPSFVERFRREAQAAANLSHPNIVSVFDWGEEAGTYFIVMEFVEGRSLAQMISDDGPLRPDRAAEIAADTAGALGFAHHHGVVHRDVKPGNILINPSGTVKVTDFGIARAVSTVGNLTQTGTVMGTATYFSPEQARGEQVDPRSDVYSLGVVLYEMLTGRPPFSGDNPVSVAYKHVQETPEPPRRRNPDIPAALEAVTLKAMAKSADDRYASAEGLQVDLGRFRADQPVTAAIAMAGAPTTVAATYAAGGAATTAVPRTEGTRAVPRVDDTYWDDESPPSGQKSSTPFVVVLLLLLALLAALLFLFAENLGIGGGDAAVLVETPRVVDLPAAEASRVIADAGLDPQLTEEANNDVPAGTVFAQDPAPGVNVEEGTPVELRVSAGAPPVIVPPVVGRNLDDAVNQLRGLGLAFEVQPVESRTVPEGEVISQTPEDGEEVPVGTVVVLEASSGPPEQPVPGVAGDSANDAGVRLARAGFEVTFSDEPSDDVEEDMVIRTEPPEGAMLEEGQTVTVVVSSGPSSLPVPGVVGDSGADATAALQDAGFRVTRSSQIVTDPDQDGVVVSQNPAADARAAPNATVNISVGDFTAPSTTTAPTTSAPTTTTTAPGAGGDSSGNRGGGSGSGGGGNG